jgi:hypothetical protein
MNQQSLLTLRIRRIVRMTARGILEFSRWPVSQCGQKRSSTRRLQFAANLTFVGVTVHSGKVIIWMLHFGDVEVSV